MISRLVFVLTLTAVVVAANMGFNATAQNQTLWYRQPAGDWNEALPLGNSRLGAMVFGKVEDEVIQLNEGTLWAGVPEAMITPCQPRTRACRKSDGCFSLGGKMSRASSLTVRSWAIRGASAVPTVGGSPAGVSVVVSGRELPAGVGPDTRHRHGELPERGHDLHPRILYFPS